MGVIVAEKLNERSTTRPRFVYKRTAAATPSPEPQKGSAARPDLAREELALAGLGESALSTYHERLAIAAESGVDEEEALALALFEAREVQKAEDTVDVFGEPDDPVAFRTAVHRDRPLTPREPTSPAEGSFSMGKTALPSAGGHSGGGR